MHNSRNKIKQTNSVDVRPNNICDFRRVMFPAENTEDSQPSRRHKRSSSAVD